MPRTVSTLQSVCAGAVWLHPQDTKIRVVLDGPPAPPSPVPEVNEQDDSESTRTGTASAGGHHDVGHAAAAAVGAGGFRVWPTGRLVGLVVCWNNQKSIHFDRR